MRIHCPAVVRQRLRSSRPRPWHAFIAPFVLLWAGCDLLPRVAVKPQGETVTSESGSNVEVAISLLKQPTTALEVYAVSSNEQEGVVSAPVRFEPADWQSAKTIRVTGVDDATSDGDTRYDVSVYAHSTSGGHPWLVARLHFVNKDNDAFIFEPIGDLPGGETSSTVADVSADGGVVVGWSGAEGGARAVRFTHDGLVGLDGPDGRAEAISPDGHLIVGSVSDARFETGRAAAAFAPGENFQLIANPPQPGVDTGLLLYFVDATAVADDGLVWGTCIQYAAYGEPIACRKAPGGPVDLALGSFVYAVDEARHFSGEANAERHAPPSSRAIYDGSALPFPINLLCDPPTGCHAGAYDFSADGTVVVGTASIPTSPPPSSGLYQTAFVYTTSEGMVALPDLDGGERTSAAYAVSKDGRIIAGYGNDERGQQAVLWIDRRPRALEDIVLDAGGCLPEGWSLREVRAMSSDGRVLVGNGINAAGDPEGFRLTLSAAL